MPSAGEHLSGVSGQGWSASEEEFNCPKIQLKHPLPFQLQLRQQISSNRGCKNRYRQTVAETDTDTVSETHTATAVDTLATFVTDPDASDLPPWGH